MVPFGAIASLDGNTSERFCRFGAFPSSGNNVCAGMVAGYEFLVVTPAIANLIRENKTFRIDSMIQTGK